MEYRKVVDAIKKLAKVDPETANGLRNILTHENSEIIYGIAKTMASDKLFVKRAKITMAYLTFLTTTIVAFSLLSPSADDTDSEPTNRRNNV